MKFHCLMHVPFEGPENIKRWAIKQGHSFNISNAWQYEFPVVDTLDVLVVMGGPMSANDDHLNWIKEEKKIIEQAIKQNKKIIGVCLGAQLIASVSGARVYKNAEKEIGWFPVYSTAEEKKSTVCSKYPDSFHVFHWHGETFDLPQGAIHLLESDACKNQAFSIDENILGLQFHMEGTKQSLIEMMENSRHEMTPGKYVQQESQIRELTDIYLDQTEVYFQNIMNDFFKTT